MPNTGSTHGQNRSKVCLFCFQKGSTMFPITGLTLQRVKTHFLANFDPSDQKMPISICSRCRNMLNAVEHSDEKKRIKVEQLPEVVDFSRLDFPVITRSSGVTDLKDLKDCPCLICKVATESVKNAPGKCGQGQLHSHKAGRPLVKTPTLPVAKPVTVCQRCRQVIGKGIRHPQPCTLTDRRSNLHSESLVDPRGREMEAVAVYKEKLSEAAGTSTYVPFASQSSSSFQIPKPQASRVVAPFESKPIPAEALAKVSDRLNLSENKTKLLATGIRSLTGRKTFEPAIRDKLSQRKEEGSIR